MPNTRVVKFRPGMLLVFARALQSLCITLRPTKEYFLTAESMPSQSRKHPTQLQAQCTAALPEENWAVRGNSPSRAGVRTTVALKVSGFGAGYSDCDKQNYYWRRNTVFRLWILLTLCNLGYFGRRRKMH